MRKQRYFILLSLFFILFFLLSCDAFSDLKDCICSSEFRIYTVTVTNQNKQPLDSLRVRIYNPTSGKEFDIDQDYASYEQGLYVVMTDAYTHKLQEGGEPVRFEAENDTLMAYGEFYFKTDECRCHVEKVSGQDTLYSFKKQSNNDGIRWK